MVEIVVRHKIRVCRPLRGVGAVCAERPGDGASNVLEGLEREAVDSARLLRDLEAIAESVFPDEDNRREPQFRIAAQGLFVALAYRELVAAKKSKGNRAGSVPLRKASKTR